MSMRIFVRRIGRYGLTTVLPLLLVACGGGSGTPSGPIVLTGVFSDSAVGGLSYATATQSGLTNAAGEFTYLAGEIITFSIGGTVIGEPVTATGAMTPLDLVPGAPLISTLLEARNVSRDPDSAESRALNRFVNIIVFLQSLDEDANPDNGITIPAGIATLLNGIQLDFDLDAFNLSFRLTYDLRNTTYQAANLGLLPTAAIRKPGAALDHFYAFQGISYNLPRIATVTVTVPTSEFIVIPPDEFFVTPNEFFTFTYDADGNLTRMSGVDPVTGIPTFVETRTYDANGNQTSFSQDFGADGSPDLIETTTWDANGRPTMRTRDDDRVSNLIFVQNFVEASIFDVNNGNLSMRTFDSDGDGTIDRINTFTYDADGNRTSAIVDVNGDGTRIITIVFDTDGNEISRIRDDGPDGIPDLIELRTYDANGNVTLLTRDFGADGTLDYIVTRTYDADSNVLFFTEDNNGDGTPESFQTSTYDADGNLIMFVVTNGAGNPNFILPNLILTITYDADGNRTSLTQDNGADGTVDFIVTSTYDADGNLTSQSVDFDGDSDPSSILPNLILTITYDADGNETSFTEVFNSAGTPDLIETLTYEAGNWTSFLFDDNCLFFRPFMVAPRPRSELFHCAVALADGPLVAGTGPP